MTDQSVSRFWDDYIDKARAYGVKPGAARWYVKHAEASIKAHGDLRLAQHSAQDVEHFLKEKDCNPRLEDWKFKQIVLAIKLLFSEMVKTS